MNPDSKLTFDYISKEILKIATNRPLVVGVDGKDASGKTTFANNIARILRQKTDREVVRISLDDFFQPRAIRSRQVDQARGCYEDTFDIERIKKHLLVPLHVDGTYTAKIFDYQTDKSVKIIKQRAPADAILVIDGVFLQRPEYRDFWDFTILLDVSDEIAIERGSVRDTQRIGDVETARKKYIDRYIASQQLYFAECEPAERASLVIDNSNFRQPKITKSL